MNTIQARTTKTVALFFALLSCFVFILASTNSAYANDRENTLVIADAAGVTDTTGATGTTNPDEGSTSTDSSEAAPSKPSIEERLANVDVEVQARIKGAGWKKPVKSGATAGNTKKKALVGLKATLINLNGVKGTINYRAYTKSGWTETAKNGAAAKTRSKPASAVRIWLTGTIKKHYDVYYRAYLQGYGWLDWTCNKRVAGTTTLSNRIGAIQVKLAKKGESVDGETATPLLNSRWDALEFKYRDDEKVGELLEVQYLGGVHATVVVRQKSGRTWTTALSCSGYVGSAGIGQAREWFPRTPEGDFGITSAFGIKDNPGAHLPYVKVTDALYWCGDRSYYNQLINIYEHPHDCQGEHLINYRPHYNYGLFFDYNTNPVHYGAGSAFFVHCTGSDSPGGTGGCIAVSSSNMVKIIRLLHYGSRVCIYPK